MVVRLRSSIAAVSVYVVPAALLLAPALALAALVSKDIAGVARYTPMTMGAFEVGTAPTNSNPAAPVGVSLSVQRLND